jgi:hypothetical protein
VTPGALRAMGQAVRQRLPPRVVDDVCTTMNTRRISGPRPGEVASPGLGPPKWVMVMSKEVFVKSTLGLAIAIPLFVACGHDSSAKSHSVSPIHHGPVSAVPHASPGWRQRAPDTANGYSWSNQRGAGLTSAASRILGGSSVFPSNLNTTPTWDRSIRCCVPARSKRPPTKVTFSRAR